VPDGASWINEGHRSSSYTYGTSSSGQSWLNARYSTLTIEQVDVHAEATVSPPNFDEDFDPAFLSWIDTPKGGHMDGKGSGQRFSIKNEEDQDSGIVNRPSTRDAFSSKKEERGSFNERTNTSKAKNDSNKNNDDVKQRKMAMNSSNTKNVSNNNNDDVTQRKMAMNSSSTKNVSNKYNQDTTQRKMAMNSSSTKNVSNNYAPDTVRSRSPSPQIQGSPYVRERASDIKKSKGKVHPQLNQIGASQSYQSSASQSYQSSARPSYQRNDRHSSQKDRPSNQSDNKQKTSIRSRDSSKKNAGKVFPSFQ